MDYSRVQNGVEKQIPLLPKSWKLGKSQNALFSSRIGLTHNLCKDIEMEKSYQEAEFEKALIYTILALTVSPTEA